MTYAPRVIHFRVLIWDGLFVFFEENFCFLVVQENVQEYVQEKAI